MADKNSAPKPSPAELAALEHAFASDPGSDAYLALADAYLSMGRFMEAMVVAKKGVRAHGDAPEGRVLLARVYAAQGKDKKALEELKPALEKVPAHADGLRLAVELHLRGGDRAAAEAAIRAAAEAAPGDGAVEAIAKEHDLPLPRPKVEEPAPAPDPAPPVVVPAPPPAAVAAAAAAQAAAGNDAPVAPPPVIAPAAPPVVTPAAAPVVTPAPAPVATVPAPRPAPAPPVVEAPRAAPQQRAAEVPAASWDANRWADDDDDGVQSAHKAKRGLMGLVATVVVLAIGFGGWFGYTRWRAERDREIEKLLTRTNDEIRRDTYASYKAATATAEQILELEPDNYVAHAYLAYINALRWGEQGEGDDFKRRAVEHLARARKAGENHSRILAADALVRFFSGEAAEAEALIEKVLEEQKSGVLYTTLGTIQMWSGDLDEAAISLEQAQRLEPNSVRVLAALGTLNRRRGMDGKAWTFYDSALRIDKEHADSLLGKALLVLDANEAELPTADRERLLKEAEAQIGKVLGLPDGAISARQLALAKFAQAQLLFATGKRDEGKRLEEEAFTLDPRNPDTRLMRGRRLLRDGEIDAAVAEIREAIRIDEKRASFYVDLSRALLAKPGGAREAVSALQTALETFPKVGRIHVLLGDAWRAVPDMDKARAAYEKAIEVEGGRMPEARAKLGAIWREKREYAKAREELERALKEFGLAATGPNLALALTEMGRVLEEGPKPDHVAAFERYARATQISETYAPPYYYLGRMSAAAGARDREQRKQAIDALERYLKLDPRGPNAEDARQILARLR